MFGEADYFEAHDAHPLLPMEGLSSLEDSIRLSSFAMEAPGEGTPAVAMGGDFQELGDYNPHMNGWEMPENLAAGSAHLFHNDQSLNLQTFGTSPYGNPPYPPPDLLTLLHLPPASGKRHGSLDIFGEPAAAENDAGFQPLQLSFPPQQPPVQVFRELFHSLPTPHGYGMPAVRGGSLFGGMEERDQASGLHEGEKSVLDFRREVGRAEARGANHFDRQKREQMNEKYMALKSLVPNPTKNDRASIVGDAIDYIKELLRTVEELKILVEKKRCGRERNKRLKSDDETAADNLESSSVLKPSESGSLRSSWLLRKSKETVVDVRIIDDEVNIKLTQRKKVNCLLMVSRVLHELQLNLLQVAGGNIGDHYIFMFNTKINEGSSVYASAIAKKLIEALDKQYPAAFP